MMPRRTKSVLWALLMAPLLSTGSARADVQIINLSDLATAPSANLPGQITLRDEVCVRVTPGQTSYRARIDGRDGQGFTLAPDSGSERLPFRVAWDTGSGTAEERSDPGDMGVFAVSSHGCATDAWLAAVEVRITRDDLQAGLAGPYHGGLVIEISAP
ncbi:MAG: hypothetical protein WAS21_08165 [Geminicoccaceae bacterium]